MKPSSAASRAAEPEGAGFIRAAAWREGVHLFNAGRYWDCHEALEPLWLGAQGLERHFLAGVILLAAALHKARDMQSARGGRRNYAKALAHLALVPDGYAGVAVRELEARVHLALRNPAFGPALPVAEEAGERA